MKKDSRILARPAHRLFVTVLFCAICGYFMSFFSSFVPLDKPVMPVALMAIFALPATLSISLISSLSSMKKLKGLNREEKRRVETIANRKIKRQVLLIAIYLIISVAMGLTFFAATLPALTPYLKYVFSVIGASIAFAVTCSIFAVIDASDLASFEAKITNRSIERKAKQALLKRLASKDQ